MRNRVCCALLYLFACLLVAELIVRPLATLLWILSSRASRAALAMDVVVRIVILFVIALKL